jgi:hypothetical protein
MSLTGSRFPWLVYSLVLVAILVLSLWPVASVLFAYGVADANGCVLNEGSAHPCLVFGADWGNALYGFGVMGWFMLATLPLGGGALIVWLIVLLIHRIAWGRAQSGPKS